MAHVIRAAALASALATTTFLAAPAMAATPPGESVPATFASSRFDPLASTADYHCRWRCGGWGGGWDRRWGRGWRRNRIDAGDVIIGAAIIGGIAAIVNAENRRQRTRDVVIVDRDPYLRDRDWRDDRRTRPIGAAGAGAASGLDNAAAMCVDSIERDARVDTVDNVARNASGWEVTGGLADGSQFRCRIGNDGRIEAIDYGAGFSGTLGAADGQWSEDAYAAARGSLGGTVRPDLAVQETTVQIARGPSPDRAVPRADARMPAYPGGPIPGEEIPETAPEPAGVR